MKCTRDHPHIRIIQGAFTKKSAAYKEELGIQLALEFKNALRRQTFLADEDFSVDGLESVVVNDVVQTHPWHEVSSWSWKKPRHINVLEVSSAMSGMLEGSLLVSPLPLPVSCRFLCCYRCIVERQIHFCPDWFLTCTQFFLSVQHA